MQTYLGKVGSYDT